MADEAQTETQTDPPSNPPPTDPPAPSDPPANGQDTTLGAGGGGEDTDQIVPAIWPEDWKERFAGSDKDDLKQLNRYKEPGNIWKALKAIRTRMDAGEFKRQMPDGSDEEALKAWRAEVGVPETQEGYLENLPEGIEITEEDKPYLDNYFKRMHARGAPKEDVHEGITAYYEMIEQATEARLESDRENRHRSEDDLRATWGPEYRGNLNNMAAMFDTHASEGVQELVFTARADDGTLLGDNPEVLKFLANLAGEVNPYGTVTPPSGPGQEQSIKDEMRQLETEMKDTKGVKYDYVHNPVKQERYRELLRLQERMEKR